MKEDSPTAMQILNQLMNLLPASYNSYKVNEALDVLEDVCKRFDSQKTFGEKL